MPYIQLNCEMYLLGITETCLAKGTVKDTDPSGLRALNTNE